MYDEINDILAKWCDPARTVAVKGYGMEILSRKAEHYDHIVTDERMAKMIKAEFLPTVNKLCREGYDTFLCATQPGFDLVALDTLDYFHLEIGADIMIITMTCETDIDLFDPQTADDLQSREYSIFVGHRKALAVRQWIMKTMLEHSSAVISMTEPTAECDCRYITAEAERRQSHRIYNLAETIFIPP